jgi:N-acylneuraminate cytidylyltransferase
MIALILARGGSKGVPKKNIKILANKPLIGYVIEAASKSKKIDQIYVSTDSQEISDISKKYGAKIIERPNFLAQDNSKDIDSFIHALDFLPNNIEEIVQLRATTPLIQSSVLDEGIDFYLENKINCTSMRSGHETPESITKFYKLENGFFKNILEASNIDYSDIPRQMCPKTFKPNGYIDILKTNVFKSNKTFYGDKILAFLTDNAIEIDSIEEFNYLEYIIKTKNGTSI